MMISKSGIQPLNLAVWALARMALPVTILGAAALFCALPSSTMAAQSPPSAAQPGTFEIEDSLFLQDPHEKDTKGVEIAGPLMVVWVPQPLQKYCLGKTSQQCATIDFCIRTTTKTVKMCQELPANLKNLPPYPAGMRPAREFTITFSHLAPNVPGFDRLRQYFDNAPKGSLDRLTARTRFKAKMQLTRMATDDNVQLLEVLSVPAP
jgi:hypothetical protein